MEDTLRVFLTQREITLCWLVLILVLMEDTLREDADVKNFDKAAIGLNPCFNGRYSQRERTSSLT